MMRLRGLLLLLALTLLAVPAAPLHADDKAAAPTPAQLVERLGSFEFGERQEAMRALDALGEPALAALKAGLRGPDMEVRRRRDELIDKIELRLESARMIQTKRLHLTYKDTPLSEAVADFGRKASCTVELAGDQSRLAGRKVTLDTGMVPFWDALDQFCAKASLVELGLTPNPETAPRPGSPEEQLVQMRMQRALALRGGDYYYNPYPNYDAGRIILVDGKQPSLPTCQTTALRIRQLPAHVSVNAPPGGDDEKTL